MICFICKDYNQTLNKICICEDSLLCDECLILTNNTNIKLCPICRRELKYKTTRDYFKFIKLLFPSLIIQFLSIAGPLIYPIYILAKEYNHLNLLSFLITLFCVSILEPIISWKISREFNIKINKYLAYKLSLMVIFIPIYSLFYSKDKYIYYLFTYIFPFYIIPTLMICIIEIIERRNNFKIYLDSKTISRQLNFERIHNE